MAMKMVDFTAMFDDPATQHDAWTGLLSLKYPHWLVSPESWIVMVHHAVFVCLEDELPYGK